MSFIVLLALVAGTVLGVLGHQAYVDGILGAQDASHKREQKELFDEINRLRMQVALHIGKEKE